MSHEIYKHRFILVIANPNTPTDDAPSLDHHVLFTSFTSSNNVSPRTYDGEVEHVGFFRTYAAHPCPLSNNVTVPAKIWEQGYYADDGMITVYPDRPVSGITWIKGWQELAKRPIPIAHDDGRLKVGFRISIWLHPDRARRYLAGESPGFEDYDKDRPAAWQRLVAPHLARFAESTSRYGNNISASLADAADLYAAASICRWTPPDYKGANNDNFGIYICLNDHAAERLLELQKEIPEPVTEKTTIIPRLAPGMIVQLFSHTYTLTGKVKSSWHATKDGKTYRIGPKHFHNIKILTPAA